MADLQTDEYDVNIPIDQAGDKASDSFEDHLYRILTDLRAINDQAFGATDPYTPTNVTADRSFDADSTSVAELADVLGTLIADLQSKGVIT